VEVNRKLIIGAAISTTLVAAAAAIIFWRRRKIAEARGHVPIGKSHWEDLQLAWGEWPGGFTVRP